MDRHDNARPIIIRRKKVVAAEHHTGAWKIAFADFATAMMAFFLVMWLINATTETQRKGLADFFSPSVPVSRVSGGGDGAFGGHEIFSDQAIAFSGVADRDRTGGVADAEAAAEEDLAGAEGEAEPDSGDVLAEIAELLRARGGESDFTEMALRHVVTRITDEGLIVELFDLPDQPLFQGDSDRPEPVTEALAVLLSEIFQLVENPVSIEGHLRSFPVVLASNPAWDLSTARAQRMRLLLEAEAIPPARMHRVTGHADRQPAVPGNRAAVRNNRLEIILLRDRG
jgi:chemotaxis protein MotB